MFRNWKTAGLAGCVQYLKGWVHCVCYLARCAFFRRYLFPHTAFCFSLCCVTHLYNTHLLQLSAGFRNESHSFLLLLFLSGLLWEFMFINSRLLFSFFSQKVLVTSVKEPRLNDVLNIFFSEQIQVCKEKHCCMHQKRENTVRNVNTEQ